MACPDRVHDGQGCIHEPLVHQVCGDLVFDAAPDLVGVDERQTGPTAIRPAAEHEARLVTQGKCPLDVVMRHQGGPEVVTEDGGDGRPDMVGRQQVAQAHQVRQRLPQQLVGQAAIPELVAVRVHILDGLVVVLAVPE